MRATCLATLAESGDDPAALEPIFEAGLDEPEGWQVDPALPEAARLSKALARRLVSIIPRAYDLRVAGYRSLHGAACRRPETAEASEVCDAHRPWDEDHKNAADRGGGARLLLESRSTGPGGAAADALTLGLDLRGYLHRRYAGSLDFQLGMSRRAGFAYGLHLYRSASGCTSVAGARPASRGRGPRGRARRATLRVAVPGGGLDRPGSRRRVRALPWGRVFWVAGAALAGEERRACASSTSSEAGLRLRLGRHFDHGDHWVGRGAPGRRVHRVARPAIVVGALRARHRHGGGVLNVSDRRSRPGPHRTAR